MPTHDGGRTDDGREAAADGSEGGGPASGGGGTEGGRGAADGEGAAGDRGRGGGGHTAGGPGTDDGRGAAAGGRRPYDASRRRTAARRNRAAVLDACRELLFRDGYQATTVRAVAERAGVSPETVYKTFGGKPGLVKALWDVTLAGDDEPLAMAERPALREVWGTRDPVAKLRLYAAFVRGVHERLAALFALLTRAGPDVGQVLAASEEERLTGVTAFVGHLADEGALPSGADPAPLADACWALTGPQLYTLLTAERGWPAAAYEHWLAGTLAATLLTRSD